MSDVGNADDGSVGSVVGLVNFVSPVTSARCRIFRRHDSALLAASLLRNVFAQADTVPLERYSVDAPNPFGSRRRESVGISRLRPIHGPALAFL